MTSRRNRTVCGRRFGMANTVLKPRPAIVEAVDSANLKSMPENLLELFEHELFGHAPSRYYCNQFTIDSFLRLGLAPDAWSAQGQVMFHIVDWAVAQCLHVHCAAHTRKSDRLRSAQRSDDVKGRTSPKQVSRTLVRGEQETRSG